MNVWEDKDLPYVFDDSNVVNMVIEFFRYGSELIYPAKSYFVAIVYSKCLEKYFKIPFFDALSDEELLPDDKFFVSYPNDKEKYDEILKNVRSDEILEYSSTRKTVEYFKREFLLDGIDNKDDGTLQFCV